jgi:hypothetical protein
MASANANDRTGAVCRGLRTPELNGVDRECSTAGCAFNRDDHGFDVLLAENADVNPPNLALRLVGPVTELGIDSELGEWIVSSGHRRPLVGERRDRECLRARGSEQRVRRRELAVQKMTGETLRKLLGLLNERRGC